MHLKVNRVRRKGKVYEYARLVRSVRDESGRPTHEVLANLGTLDPRTVENLRAALDASRRGEGVVTQRPERSVRRVPVPVQRSLACFPPQNDPCHITWQ